MNGRLILGISILCLTLALAIGVGIGARFIHAPAEAALTEAAELALRDQMDKAIPKAQFAYKRWQHYQDITAAFADHTPMDDTQRLFQEMLIYAQADERPHFAACCMQLSAMLNAIYETHGFSLKNIL